MLASMVGAKSLLLPIERLLEVGDRITPRTTRTTR